MTLVRNFLFHRVNPVRDPLWDPMDMELFDRCVRHLSLHFEVMRIEDLVAGRKQESKRPVATILFDDGYKDNLEYAADILTKYKCMASFYVVTDCIEYNKPTWTYILDFLFSHSRIQNIDLDFSFLPENCRTAGLKTSAARLDFVRTLKPVLKRIKQSHRAQVMDRVTETFTDVEIPSIMMSWDDLRQLQQAGHTIGSHSKTHSVLGTIEDVGEVRLELIESGKAIEKNLGYFPAAIAYPVGSYNDTTIRLARESGYQMGLAVRQRSFDPQHDSVFEVPRIELYNESWLKTRIRMSRWGDSIRNLLGS